MIDILISECLIYPATYSKKFGFSYGDVDSFVQCFDDRFIVEMNVWYWSGNMILDTSV